MVAMQLHLRKALSAKDRNLVVKDFTWVFDPVPHLKDCICVCLGFLLLGFTVYVFVFVTSSFVYIMCLQVARGMSMSCVIHPEATVFGQRAGSLSGLIVVHKDKGNSVRLGKGWKLAVAHQVMMLPRSEMFKPEVLWLVSSGFLILLFSHQWLCFGDIFLSKVQRFFFWNHLQAHGSTPHLGRAKNFDKQLNLDYSICWLCFRLPGPCHMLASLLLS